MRIAIASSEMAPFVKVGGLGDVIGALPKEFARLGHQVRVFLPRPPGIERLDRVVIRTLGEVLVELADGPERVGIDSVRMEEDGFELILIRHDASFQRPNPYVDPKTGTDWPDNARRFTLFSKAIVEALIHLGPAPEALHLNDYQTGLVPILVREAYAGRDDLQQMGILYAIHNLGYQGIYPPSALEDIGQDLGRRFFYPAGPLEFWKRVNFMKAAILYADLITTVSERYAQEIQDGEEYGFGLEGVLRTRSKDLIGILNGIDPDVWDPATDPLIPANYRPTDLGPKRENKLRLLAAMELPEDLDAPVIGMITRLVDQKGLDLIEAAAEDLLAMKLRLVVLGSGMPKYETLMLDLRKRFPDRVGVNLTFNDPLAHLIEAGSDMFLMPSRYEPCGLNQMYSLRYGTIPIVRKTGGLADTVQEFDPETGRGNGFLFEEYSAEAMLDAIERAVGAYGRKRAWKRLMAQSMRLDFTWKRVALKYVEAYQRAAASRR